MLQAKKRATPAGITLLAKPHASLGSLSSVALSSAGEKSNLSVAFDQNTVNVQSYRRNCLISPSQVSNHADSRCLTTPTYSRFEEIILVKDIHLSVFVSLCY